MVSLTPASRMRLAAGVTAWLVAAAGGVFAAPPPARLGVQRAEPTATRPGDSAAGTVRAGSIGQETRLLQSLRMPGSVEARRGILSRLSLVATDESVGAMTGLLGDPALSHMARVVLERINSKHAREALRWALAHTAGAMKAGIACSLGSLRDPLAAPALVSTALGSDATAASAAIGALGHLGGVRGETALIRLLVTRVDLEPQCLEALVTVVDDLLRAGKVRAAADLSGQMMAARTSPVVRAGALQALARCGGLMAEPYILHDLFSSNPAIRRAAGRLCRFRTSSATRPLLDCYAQLRPDAQLTLLTALATRADGEAIGLALRELGSPRELVRAAAVRAVVSCGSADTVLALTKLAALRATEADRASARAAAECLARLPGVWVTRAIVRVAGTSAAATRIVALQAIGDRLERDGMDAALTAAGDTDPEVSAEGWRVLERLAWPVDQARMVGLLGRDLGPEVRALAERAVAANVRRFPAADDGLASVPDGSDAWGRPYRLSVVSVLAAVGGPKALNRLGAAARSEDPEVQRAAVTVLSERWVGAGAVTPLLASLPAQRDPSVALMALRGVLRLLATEVGERPVEAAQGAELALGFASGAAERRAALRILRDSRTSTGATAIAGLLTDVEICSEAADAILAMAQPTQRGGTALPAVTGAEMRGALEAVAEKGPDAARKAAARALLPPSRP